MKKMIVASVLASLICPVLQLPVKANPAVLAAPALCSTGVGCILVGTVIISGVAYYVYTHQGHKVYVKKTGYGTRTIHSEKDEYDLGIVTADDYDDALTKCLQTYGYSRSLLPRNNKNGTWTCVEKE